MHIMQQQRYYGWGPSSILQTTGFGETEKKRCTRTLLGSDRIDDVNQYPVIRNKLTISELEKHVQCSTIHFSLGCKDISVDLILAICDQLCILCIFCNFCMASPPFLSCLVAHLRSLFFNIGDV
jgi:hypothetical protein